MSILYRLLILVFLAFPFNDCFSQSLNVISINADKYPVISARISVLDGNNNPIKTLTKENFKVIEKGSPCPVVNFECPPIKHPSYFSTVLGRTDYLVDTLSWRIFYRKWVLSMRKDDECGFADWSNKTNNLTLFTSNKDVLIEAINKSTYVTLKETGILHCVNSGEFLNSPGSGSYGYLWDNGVNKRISIFVTDCDSDIGFDPLDLLKEKNITFYVVACGVPAVDGLKKHALGTGGMYWENLNTKEEIEAVVDKIYQWEQFGQACTLEWISSGCETTRDAEIKIEDLNLSKKVYYKVPPNVLPSIEFSPSNSIVFGKVVPGNTIEKQVRITARKAPVTIYGIKINDSKFSIKDWGGQAPEFSLKPGESRTLTVEFTPSDSTYTLARFDINSNACLGNTFYASGGYSTVPPKTTTLRVVSPNGGEVFGIGSDTIIKWDGVMPHEKVRLDYSTDKGSSWNMITDKAKNLEYHWKVPAPASDRCLMKATYSAQSNGNTTVLSGHKSDVYSVAWDSFGFGLPGGTEGEIDVWDIKGDTIKNRILTPGLKNNSVAWSPDGQFLASGLSGGGIKIFKPSGSLYANFTDHSDDVLSLAWSPDAGRLVSGSADGTVKIWDIVSRSIIRTLDPNAPWIQSVAFSPDGKMIAAGTSENHVELWNAANLQPVKTLGGFTGSVYSVSFSPDSKYIAAGSSDKTIKVFDLQSGSVTSDLIGENGTVYSVAFSPDGQNIASGSNDGTIIIWDWKTKAVVNRLTGHSSAVRSLAWSEDGVYLASGSSDRTIRIWLVYASPDQNDVSDKLWKIAAPLALCHEVDMGKVPINEEKDSVVKAYIENKGEIAVNISKIIAGGGFDLISPALPVTIQPGGGLDVQFRFNPPDFGPITATIFSITQSDTLSCTIKGEGVYPYKQLNLGSTTFCELLADTINIENPSNKDIMLKSFAISGADKSMFSVIKAPSAGYILKPGSSAGYIIGFKPDKNTNGIKKADLEIETESKEIPLINVDLEGTAISYDLAFDSDTVDFGTVPVAQTGNKQLKIRNNGEVDATVKEITSDNKDVSVSPVNALIKSQEEATFDLSWLPSKSGPMSSAIRIIISSPCPDTIEVNIKGNAIDNELYITEAIDYGALAWCKEKTDSVVVVNATENPVTIKEMAKSGADASLFDFNDAITLPKTLNKDEKLVRLIKYNGSASTDGIKTAEIKTKAVIDGSEKEFTTTLKAERVSISVSSDPAVVSFSDIMPGAKDTRKVTIKNESKMAVEITEIKVKNYPAVFTVTPNTVITLAPNQEQALDIEFHPQSAGSYADELSLTLKMNECGDNKVIQINGKAIGGSILGAVAYLPDTSAQVGDIEFRIPLFIKLDRDTIIKDLSYTAKIRFSATTYEPTTAIDAIFINNKIVSGERIVELQGTKALVTRTDTILCGIKGNVYLGLNDRTDLILDDVKLSDSLIKVRKLNGELTVKGLCQQNISRIKIMDNISLSVVPSPASDESEIVVTGDAKGTMSVSIYSIEGINKGTIEINKTGYEAKQKLNLKDYSSGVYQLVLQSGGECLNVPMVVVK